MIQHFFIEAENNLKSKEVDIQASDWLFWFILDGDPSSILHMKFINGTFVLILKENTWLCLLHPVHGTQLQLISFITNSHYLILLYSTLRMSHTVSTLLGF